MPSMVRLAPLLHKFIKEGQTQCVLLGSRLDAALLSIIRDKPSLVSTDIGGESALISVHIQVVAKVYRAYKREDSRTDQLRRYQRTNHLRRKMGGADLRIINTMISDMVDTVEDIVVILERCVCGCLVLSGLQECSTSMLSA